MYICIYTYITYNNLKRAYKYITYNNLESAHEGEVLYIHIGGSIKNKP